MSQAYFQIKHWFEPTKAGERLADLYWSSDLQVKEIEEKFKTKIYSDRKPQGTARFLRYVCGDCELPFFVSCRTEAVSIYSWCNAVIKGRRVYTDFCLQCRAKPRPELPSTAKPEIKSSSRRAEIQSYPAYLKSDHWRLVRQQALERSNFKCALCASPSSLHVHHNSYARLGAEEPHDLTVLCAGCHDLFHQHRQLVKHSRAN